MMNATPVSLATIDQGSGATRAPDARDAEPTKRARYASYALGGFAALFMAFDASMKLAGVPEAVKGTTELGYPPSVIFPLGLVQLACLALYLAPRTAVLGAVLWTGYLGGAVATHVRVGNPLFSHELFPTYVAAMLWGALVLRRPALWKAIWNLPSSSR